MNFILSATNAGEPRGATTTVFSLTISFFYAAIGGVVLRSPRLLYQNHRSTTELAGIAVLFAALRGNISSSVTPEHSYVPDYLHKYFYQLHRISHPATVPRETKEGNPLSEDVWKVVVVQLIACCRAGVPSDEEKVQARYNVPSCDITLFPLGLTR